jgi:hypothetical protein
MWGRRARLSPEAAINKDSSTPCYSINEAALAALGLSNDHDPKGIRFDVQLSSLHFSTPSTKG